MLFLMLQLAAATGPSFDCTRARTRVEHAICASAELSQLDREEARIYSIARVIPQARRDALLARQRQFLRDRNGCTESAEPLEECLRDAYLGDIGDLRRVAELQDDNEGISSGPNRFECAGYHDVYVTLFDTSPTQGYLAIPDVNEGQPLVRDEHDPKLLVGRYATDMIYDSEARSVRVGNTDCTPPR